MGSELVFLFTDFPGRQNNVGPSILPLGYWGSRLTFHAIQCYDRMFLGLFPALACEAGEGRGHV